MFRTQHKRVYATTKDPLMTRYEAMLKQTAVFSQYTHPTTLPGLCQRDASDITLMKREHSLSKLCII